jgi:arabinan endo-1,5-alpha-L-arabinosidase
MPELKGVQDFYLTAEGLGGETLLGNIKFDKGVDTTRTTIRHMDGRTSLETLRQSITFDRENSLVRLASEEKWTLFDANGVAVKHGYGREFRMSGLPHGAYFVHSAGQMLSIRY